MNISKLIIKLQMQNKWENIKKNVIKEYLKYSISKLIQWFYLTLHWVRSENGIDFLPFNFQTVLFKTKIAQRHWHNF